MRQNKIDVVFINDTRYDGSASDIAKRKFKGYFDKRSLVIGAEANCQTECAIVLTRSRDSVTSGLQELPRRPKILKSS